ncbi:MAG: polyhydroxyalkanoate synthesis regulator DNA-binding domain-containing protein [Gemmataceae bacterium]
MSADDPQAAPPGTEGETVHVVRYPNRRLYDKSLARYVTLQEVADVVRGGKTVVIRDSKTGDDLTAAILLQIILEQHPERMEMFPVPVLHSMIRANEVVLGYLREYLRQTLHLLEFWQKAATHNPVLSSMDWMKRLFTPRTAPAAPPPTPTAPPPTQAPAAPPSPAAPAAPAPPLPNLTEMLAERVAELERRLNAVGERTDDLPAVPPVPPEPPKRNATGRRASQARPAREKPPE